MQRYQNDEMEEPFKARLQTAMGRIAAHPFLDPLLTRIGGSCLDRVRNSWGFTARYAGIYRIFGAMGAAQLLSPELKAELKGGCAPLHEYFIQDELSKSEAVERVTALCLRGYTNNQLLRDIDTMSMAHSLEVRVPFLDVPLIDLSLSLPAAVKLEKDGGVGDPFRATYRSTGSKRILIDAGLKKGFLREGIDLQPKRGFTMPFYGWLRGPLREVMEDTLSERTVRQRGLFRTTQVEKARRDFSAGKTEWYFSWLLMMIELWCREVLDGIPQERAS
jgi:asparagine synthase (glutamine-hydrolysing)